MARKKNKIFKQEETNISSNNETIKIEQANLVPDISTESMVESIPDDPIKIDLLNSKIEQLQQTEADLALAQQKIQQLEAKIQQLQSDNDVLLLKLAEISAKNAEVPIKNESKHKNDFTTSNKKQQVTCQNVASKYVNYPSTNYSNNGYGTWH